jgi:hypothetical protein
MPVTILGESMAEDKKWRDWLAVGLSVLSLGISALTAYHTIFFQRDDVRVEVGESLRMLRDKNQFTLQETQEFTFINSGNRQAAVTGIYGMLVLVTNRGNADAQCNQKLPLHKSIYLEASPLVLKPGEIQVLQVKVAAEYPWKKESGMLRFREEGAVEGAANYVVCLALYVTTPDSSSVRWVQPLYTLPNIGEGKDAFEKEEPLKVLQRTHLGFG